ncbi:hypothetical protein DIPPA_55796 [Diplonema papillatum]|nr:hypothetical protein DIPPA_50055 [Diplonema papillatum]KAJ9444233.1 hypothetical protein DIPPA_55796 [Diplonema papillatum]
MANRLEQAVSNMANDPVMWDCIAKHAHDLETEKPENRRRKRPSENKLPAGAAPPVPPRDLPAISPCKAKRSCSSKVEGKDHTFSATSPRRSVSSDSFVHIEERNGVPHSVSEERISEVASCGFDTLDLTFDDTSIPTPLLDPYRVRTSTPPPSLAASLFETPNYEESAGDVALEKVWESGPTAAFAPPIMLDNEQRVYLVEPSVCTSTCDTDIPQAAHKSILNMLSDWLNSIYTSFQRLLGSAFPDGAEKDGDEKDAPSGSFPNNMKYVVFAILLVIALNRVPRTAVMSFLTRFRDFLTA